MIVLLTDAAIIDAANRGAHRFMARHIYLPWFCASQDVLQEAQIIALEFLRRFDNPKLLDPRIISRRVYFSLLDAVRLRSKYRTRHPCPRFYSQDCDFLEGTLTPSFSVESVDLLVKLCDKLTRKEKLTLELLKQGFSQVEISRELRIPRSCVCKRIANIRRKARKYLLS